MRNALRKCALPLAAGLVALLPLAAHAAYSVYSDSGGNFALSFGTGVFCNSSTICGIASTILYLINNVLVPLIFAISFIVFLYGIARAYIFSNGDPERVREGHRLLLWGLIGFVVMISLWGIVNIVANTFGLGSYGAPPTPTSY